MLLFNPRMQQWNAHFFLQSDGAILPRSAVGRATARLLHFDDDLRIRQRADLIAAGKMTALLPGSLLLRVHAIGYCYRLCLFFWA